MHPIPSLRLRFACVLGVLFALWAALLFAGCHDQHDPGAYGSYLVGVRGCTTDQHDRIVRELRYLEAVGPDWTPDDAGDVTVVCAELPPGTAGAYALGTDEVDVDPAQAQGDALMTATGHELVHWLLDHHGHAGYARLHVCHLVNQLGPDDVGCWHNEHGRALMNPALPETGSGPGWDSAWGGDDPGAYDTTYLDWDFVRAGMGH